MKKTLILVTNDDGITAPGIKALIEVAREFGEVVVVAPDSPRSAQGHAITITDPLRLKKVDIFDGLEAYECSGTPVDCVKLAKAVILKDRTPDLCVSGINHGSNASINIFYSGTMSAAMEAAMEGVNSIGFSLMDFSWKADFSATQTYARQIIAHTLKHGLGETKLLNVNIPKLPENELKGIKICHQADAEWIENYQEMEAPHGQKVYWLTGEFVNHDQSPNSDIRALSEGYVSVVPCGFDLTKREAISGLKGLEK